MGSPMSIEEARVLGSELMRRRREIDALELAWSIDAAAFAGSGYHVQGASATGIDWLKHNCQMGGAGSRTGSGSDSTSTGCTAA